MVQSALSTSIAKLERELGVSLFDRSRQQIRLTAAGDRFRTHAYEVLRASRAAAESVGEFRGSLSDRSVRISDLVRPHGCRTRTGGLSPGASLRPAPIAPEPLGASAYLSALVEGSLDVALVSAPDRLPAQLEMRLLFEEPMVFVCREDHGLATRTPVDLGAVAGEDLVGFPPEFGLRRLMEGAFHAAGVQPRTQYEVPAGFAAIADLVRNGLGTAFMPESEAPGSVTCGRRTLRSCSLAGVSGLSSGRPPHAGRGPPGRRPARRRD